MSPPDLSVVIVSWNTIAALVRTLDSMDAAVGSLTKEVVVVDNASVDGSPEVLAQRHDIRLLALDENSGFTRAANLGRRPVSLSSSSTQTRSRCPPRSDCWRTSSRPTPRLGVPRPGSAIQTANHSSFGSDSPGSRRSFSPSPDGVALWTGSWAAPVYGAATTSI